MEKTLEAAAIALYAVALQAAALALWLLAFVGPQGIGRHLGFAALLCVFGAASSFVVARLGLRHAPIDRPGRGLWLGLGAGAGFYVPVLLLFGVIPALGALAEGASDAAADYLFALAGIVLRESLGLPLLLGAAGGAAYGALRGRLAART